MPLKLNVPDASRWPDWEMIPCPLCSAECWESDPVRQAKAEGYSIACTECALNSDFSNFVMFFPVVKYRKGETDNYRKSQIFGASTKRLKDFIKRSINTDFTSEVKGKVYESKCEGGREVGEIYIIL